MPGATPAPYVTENPSVLDGIRMTHRFIYLMELFRKDLEVERSEVSNGVK